MANEQNLIPQNKRTKSEQKEIARKGGKASRKIKKTKKVYKRTVGNDVTTKSNRHNISK